MMIRITFVSPEGGVGKSTIIYYVTKLLSDKIKTLIVDISDSATLSGLFSVQNNILADEGYFVDMGNVGIVSFSRIFDTNLDLEKITLKYSKILNDYSLVLVEYPVHFYLKSIKMEYMAFNSLFRAKNYIFTVTLPQEIIIKTALNYTSSLISYLSSLNSEIYNEALIINMIKDDLGTKDMIRYHKNVFGIKFDRDLIFKGFYNVSPPDDFLQISKFIEKLIE